IGMDVSAHVVEAVSAGFAPRMDAPFETAIQILLRAGRLGQKNGRGFYKYERGDKGRPRKEIDPETEQLLAGGQRGGKDSFSAEEITSRMMVPLIFEAARCVEEKIAASPGEADMCLILGLGLPRYLGGALKYADYLGLENLLAQGRRFASLGPIYQPGEQLIGMARRGEVFYPL
ncbi:MAG TPA: fatty acid oxidation complex subunit alpha FadB, partial [Methylocella sp.]|nr:fatty acid oxidation complex subunit alpha FadB [Methylocella sp.]